MYYYYEEKFVLDLSSKKGNEDILQRLLLKVVVFKYHSNYGRIPVGSLIMRQQTVNFSSLSFEEVKKLALLVETLFNFQPSFPFNIIKSIQYIFNKAKF